MSEAFVWAIGLGVLGAIVGSFLATLVIRWPQERSVLRGRSACDGCGRTLQPRDLVPLVSALWLRGQCRTCGARIDPRQMRIELAAAVIGALAGGVAPGLEGMTGAMFGWLLLTLAALDMAELWLPDPLTASLALAGIAAGLAGFDPSLTDRIIGGLAGFASLWLIAFGYRLLRGRDGMGGGDPKLFGAIGLWLGWRMLPSVLLLASLVGLGIVLFARLRGRAMAADHPLPLGALLAIAAYPAWLVMVGMSG